jgi:hypothetical protein
MVWCNCVSPLWFQGGECGNCGGSIASKEWKETIRKWEIENKESYCSICKHYFCSEHGYKRKVENDYEI